MQTLLACLIDSEVSLYTVLAQQWKVDLTNLQFREKAAALNSAMLDESRAAAVYAGLDDAQRGALQTLAGSGEAKMPRAMFERMFGAIRKPAQGMIERERPHEAPQGAAEALFYRGLIYEAFEQAPTGMRAVLFVPPDLMDVLPMHQTAYDDLATAAPGPVTPADVRLGPVDADDIDNIRTADTSLVDDLITLLAHVQNRGMDIENGKPTDASVRAVYPHLLVKDLVRLDFLLGVAISTGLLAIDGRAVRVQRENARPWLEASRGQQVRHLADAWRASQVYRELWHVPGLHPEPTGWPYDAVVAREAMLRFLRDLAPHESWWSLDELIFTIKEIDPDFQRPNGSYDSWYIRDATGDFLHGFESWDAVEGALIEFTINGPLHWLGMVDLGEDAARLTAYGRAFIAPKIDWPDPQIPADPITVQQDGTMSASRRSPAIDRFQLARFTSWISPATLDGSAPYVYRLNADGIQQAAKQGIETTHIAGFITRVTGDSPVPEPIRALLDKWQAVPTPDGQTEARGVGGSATMERMMVLRTTAQETLDHIIETPALRRYLGARLGPMAVAVRADQWEPLREALGEAGIDVRLRE